MLYPSAPSVPGGPELDDVVVNDFALKFPRYLRPIVGVDSTVGGLYYEAPAMRGLLASISPGDVVYDVGMSWGVFTCIAALLAGDQGEVHSFEANPEVIRGAHEFIAANGLSPRVRLNLACAGDVTGQLVPFHIVPAASSVASTRNRDIQSFHTDSYTVHVPMVSLDSYVALQSRPPRVIKLDVEGSEYVALQGAAHLLRAHHPLLVIETHGREIEGIGGSVAGLCQLLDGSGYDLFDLAPCRLVEPAQYAERYREAIGYLLAAPPEMRARLTARLSEVVDETRPPFPLETLPDEPDPEDIERRAGAGPGNQPFAGR